MEFVVADQRGCIFIVSRHNYHACAFDAEAPWLAALAGMYTPKPDLANGQPGKPRGADTKPDGRVVVTTGVATELAMVRYLVRDSQL